MPVSLVSVIISTKNGSKWLPACFASLRGQTIFDKLEIIVVDGCSTDGAPELARRELAGYSRATVVVTETDLGFTGGNNYGAELAKGELLFMLNDDTKLEPDCLQRLIEAMEESGADCAVPSIADYDSMEPVPSAQMGFDIFGRPTWSEKDHDLPGIWHDCFMSVCAGFLIRAEVWKRIGGFDVKHFLNADDDDVSWKVWLAGYRNVFVKNAIIHHHTHRPWEIKEFHRYLVNRNSLLVIGKNAQHVLLLCGLLQIGMLLGEALILLVVTRHWDFIWKSYFKAIIDAVKMWPHVHEMRRRNRLIRRRSDWAMARMFLRFRINRWNMIKTFFSGKRPSLKPTAKPVS